LRRQIIKIDETLCNGCGDCVPGCAEGAIQLIDGKARLVSDLMCDGLGACLGECPVGAITIENREAEPYSEDVVIAEMVKKGRNTVLAHLRHLDDHGEKGYYDQALAALRTQGDSLGFRLDDVLGEIEAAKEPKHNHQHAQCPGSQSRTFARVPDSKPGDGKLDDGKSDNGKSVPSQLRQWPIQLHLVNPNAPHFRQAHLLVAADCVAFALGDFHQRHLAGRALVIACPKLDSNMDVYVDKIRRLADEAKVSHITVMIMEVPCCGGLVAVVRQALDKAETKVPVTVATVGIEGNILHERTLDVAKPPRSLLFR
jgi:NAD-dependent dihydropyrimidine dehydrogenase PreA subunit